MDYNDKNKENFAVENSAMNEADEISKVSVRTPFQRITAAGFIVMTLAGNFWLVYMIMKKDIPALIVNSFEVGMGLVILGGLGMLVSHLRSKFSNI